MTAVAADYVTISPIVATDVNIVDMTNEYAESSTQLQTQQKSEKRWDNTTLLELIRLKEEENQKYEELIPLEKTSSSMLLASQESKDNNNKTVNNQSKTTESSTSKSDPLLSNSDSFIDVKSLKAKYKDRLNKDEITIIAKTLYGECRGVKSVMQQAAVVWSILNRVDANYGSIKDVVVTSGHYTGYSSSHPVWDSLYQLTEDVMIRWLAEKDGYKNTGRVLPQDYLWFAAGNKSNVFRNAFRKPYSIWDFTLPNPYNT